MAAGGRQDFAVFISAASSEFEHARDTVANDLQSLGLHVRVQRSFRLEQGAATTLDKLHNYIRGCRRVVALLGTRSGAFPPEAAVRPEYRAMLPEGFLRASYTQWEVIFARHHGIRTSLHVAKGFPPEREVGSGEDGEAQARWLDYLFHDQSGRGLDRLEFANVDALRANLLQEGWPNLARPKPKNLPYKSIGELFKGREDFLQKLRVSFTKPTSQGATAIVGRAMHGLGGIGKTRAAVEYALAHEADYSALLFVAARTPQDLENNVAALAGPVVLDLPDESGMKQEVRFAAVLNWLRLNPGWFLIVDNVDTEEAARAVEALLAKLSGGHVAITSRIAAWRSGVERLALDLLAPDAACALLRDGTPNREKRPDEEADIAKLAHELGYLSLALTQAAALIDTDFSLNSFAAYLGEWEKNRSTLLAEHNDRDMGYPLSVPATWLTTFEQLNAPARTLLNALAFFAPEPIPRSLAETTERDSGNRLFPREAFNDLARYSFLSGDANLPVFTVHRLVQQVARDRMSKAEAASGLAAATRWIAAATAGLEAQDVRSWPILEPLLLHATALFELSPPGVEIEETSSLLNAFGVMLHGKASYGQAEPLFRRALAINEKSLGSDHPDIAAHLNNLASLLRATNQLGEAEQMFRRALAVSEKSLGSDHPDVATNINNLANLLRASNRLTEAEPLFRRALAISEKSFGPDHPSVAIRLNSLAGLLQDTNRPTEAEQLYRRALIIDEVSFGPDHPSVSTSLNNLALLLQTVDRFAEAEPFFRRALIIREKNFGPVHPSVATCINNLAILLRATNRLAEAEPLFRRALAINEASYGPAHPDVATCINNLASLLRATNRLGEAEPLFRRALAIREKSLSADHPDVANSLNSLAGLLRATNRLGEAEPLFRRALAIDEKSYGPDHPTVAIHLNNLASLLGDTKRLAEAEPMYRRTVQILLASSAAIGQWHPNFNTVIGNYAGALDQTGRTQDEIVEEIGRLFREAGLEPPR